MCIFWTWTRPLAGRALKTEAVGHRRHGDSIRLCYARRFCAFESAAGECYFDTGLGVYSSAGILMLV